MTIMVDIGKLGPSCYPIISFSLQNLLIFEKKLGRNLRMTPFAKFFLPSIIWGQIYQRPTLQMQMTQFWCIILRCFFIFIKMWNGSIQSFFVLKDVNTYSNQRYFWRMANRGEWFQNFRHHGEWKLPQNYFLLNFCSQICPKLFRFFQDLLKYCYCGCKIIDQKSDFFDQWLRKTREDS